jgi:hypothetical protein
MAQWKALEREVAAFFNGTRRVRVSYSDKIGDIIHPSLSIECKYGKQVPKYLMPAETTILTTLTTQLTRYVIVHSSVFPDRIKPTQWIFGKGKFLEEAMDQARRYNPTLKPIVCVKGRYSSGFWIIQEFPVTIGSQPTLSQKK